MKIYVHDQVYQRVKDVAHAQCRTKSDLVQDALVRFLGMEGMPLDDDAVYGRDDLKDESPNT
jgi:predicted transcriptional regulator